jgi:hypothetical protein
MIMTMMTITRIGRSCNTMMLIYLNPRREVATTNTTCDHPLKRKETGSKMVVTCSICLRILRTYKNRCDQEFACDVLCDRDRSR